MGKQNGKVVPNGEAEAPVSKTNERPTVMYDDTECYLNINTYYNNKLAMALELVEKETGEPYTVVSVNLGEEYREGTFVPRGSTFIDVNNNDIDDLKDLFEKTGAKPRMVFGQPYTKPSGWVEYPIYDFDMDKLKEFDPTGFDNYSKDYQSEFPKAQKRLNERMFGFSPDDAEGEDEYDDTPSTED